MAGKKTNGREEHSGYWWGVVKEEVGGEGQEVQGILRDCRLGPQHSQAGQCMGFICPTLLSFNQEISRYICIHSV